MLPLKPIICLLSGFIILMSCQNTGPKYDLLVRNGHIFDGSGSPWFQADIAIKNGVIAEMGHFKPQEARQTIDASGLCVSPGFIDVHTHTDRKIASNSDVINYLQQGVTTVVGGNCGGHEFPLNELFTKLKKSGMAINFASFTGHNTIRKEVIGREDRAPSPAELKKMQELVKQEMEAGAIGLSTGLAYVPGRYSKTREIIALAKMIQPYQGIYATHMRNQGKNIRESIEEAIRIGREAGVPVQISHIKLAAEEVWGMFKLITIPIEQARAAGQQVFMDIYPYTATSSGFGSSFPGWALAGGQVAFLKRLENPELVAEMKQALIERRFTSQRGINRLESVYVSYNKNHHEYEGKNIAQVLTMLGREQTAENAAELVIEMYKDDAPRGVFFQMANEDVAFLMQRPYAMIASDGKIEIPGKEVPHPRAYGTFPRVLAKYVREDQVLSLAQAVHKMTALPAQAMGFYDRGILRPGMKADMVIFNPKSVQDKATFSEPHQYPEGIEWVIVNGKITLEKGLIKNHKAGQILFGKGRK